jgi:hypothetical protein
MVTVSSLLHSPRSCVERAEILDLLGSYTDDITIFVKLWLP